LLLFGVFARLALLFAYIEIYGVLAYLTSQRLPEFGARIALGATPQFDEPRRLRQSLRTICIGACIGLLAGFAAARLLKHFVAGVPSTDPSTFAVMIPILVLATLFASFLPALRASRTEPMSVLKQE
jgi:ABC-type antimicrobial peptide transport system permease subunit